MADTATPNTPTDGGAPPAPATEGQQAPEPMITVTINGQERKITASEAAKRYELAEGANQRFEEAAQMRKEAMDFIKTLRTDPARIFNDPNIGADFKKLAQEALLRDLELQNMTPEERKYAAQQEELEQYKAREKATKDAEENARAETEAKEMMASLDREIGAAVVNSGLPKTSYTVARIAYYMERAIESGYTNVTPKDVVGFVRNEYKAMVKDLLGADDVDVHDFLGDAIKKVRAADVKKYTNQPAQPTSAPTTATKPASTQPAKKKSKDEWKRELYDTFKNQ